MASYDRTVSDTIVVADSVSAWSRPSVLYSRSIISTITVTDQAQARTEHIYDQTVSDTMVVSDAQQTVLERERRHSDTATAVDTALALPLPPKVSDTIFVSDAVTVEIHVPVQLSHAETATATDSVRVSVGSEPGVGHLLRPRRNGTHTGWVIQPAMIEWYQHLCDNSDLTYLSIVSGVTGSAGDEFTVGIEPVLIPVCSPHRIAGLTVSFRAMSTSPGGSARVAAHLGSRSALSDVTVVVATGSFAWYTVWLPCNPWSGRRWTSADLRDRSFFLGLSLVSGLLMVSEFLVSVAVEPVPAKIPLVNASGYYSEWTTYPAGSRDYYDLNSDTGDLNYISGTGSQRHTVRLEGDILADIPSNFQIDKAQLSFRARGGTFSPLVRDEGSDQIGPLGQWSLSPASTEWRTHSVPFYGRPKFTTGIVRWDTASLQAAEWGVQAGGSTEDVSQLSVEVFTSLVPEEVTRILPTANGGYNQFTIISPNIGESAWQDVSTYLPDDTTYLRGAVATSPLWQTFQCTNTYANTWYGTRVRLRVRTTPTTTGTSRVAPVLVVSGRTYVGREFQLTDQTDWSDLVEDFWLNPITGRPWLSTELQSIEVGVVVVSGSVDLSWCVLDAGSVPPRAQAVDSSVIAFTTTGAANVARCITDSLVWVIDKFEVGRGGYQFDNPAVVLPVDPADLTLADPVWSGRVARSSAANDIATYWCPVPPNSFSETIGELMLWARIVSSSNILDVPGTYFPMACLHFPASFHTQRSIFVIRVDLDYSP